MQFQKNVDISILYDLILNAKSVIQSYYTKSILLKAREVKRLKDILTVIKKKFINDSKRTLFKSLFLLRNTLSKIDFKMTKVIYTL